MSCPDVKPKQSITNALNAPGSGVEELPAFQGDRPPTVEVTQHGWAVLLSTKKYQPGVQVSTRGGTCLKL